MTTKISLKRAIELIRGAEHVKVDVSQHENSTGEVFTSDPNAERQSITLLITSYGGGFGPEENNYDIVSAELVDGRIIKLIDEEDEEYNVYLFNLVPITNLTAE